MQESESNPKTEEQSWFFIRFFYGLIRSIQSVYYWLFPRAMDFSNDASGELMRRMLTQKSFFDEVSASWVGLKFWNKAFAVLGFMLVGGLIGIALSAPVICALSVLFVCIGTHLLFVSHEHHRRTAAKLMVEELIIVQENLEAQRDFFKEASKASAEHASELEDKVKQMQNNTAALQQEIQVLHKASQELTAVVEDVTQTTDSLIDKEEKIGVALEETKVQIEKTNTVLDQLTSRIEGISETVVAFHDTVEGAQKTQQTFAEAVGDFGFFVSTLSQKVVSQSALDDEWSEKIAAIQNENEENERFIEQYKSLMAVGEQRNSQLT